MPRLILMLLVSALALPASAADWPQFRGPDGKGLYEGPELPVEWGTDKNVAWKEPIPGKGWSSPVVSKGRVYLTTAVAAKPDDRKSDQSLRALCLDAKTGTIIWDVEVFHQHGATSPPGHAKGSHASPTPLIDGDRLYVHFGHQGTAALDLSGKVIWSNREQVYDPRHGNGASPILVDGNLIFSCDGYDKQFVVGLDAKTGKRAWKAERNTTAKSPFSFATAQVVEVNGRKQVVSPASDFVAAYDPETGKELWKVRYPVSGWSVIPQPVVGHGLVYVCTGYVTQHVIAIRPEGSGDITQTAIAWSNRRSAPNTPSPLLVGNELYLLADGGILSCLDAKSGDVHWSERVPGAYSASPICANGKIYITNETGTGLVVAAGKEFKELGRSELKEKTYATFAAVDGALYVRTETQLYCFRK